MTLSIFRHPACEKHENAPGHIEAPQRYRAVDEVVETLSGISLNEAPRADLTDLSKTHTSTHIERLIALMKGGGGPVDGDTGTNQFSWEASLRASGAVIAAVDAVLKDGGNAFCAVRPPGHHALSDRAMGFCLFNNIAVGAERALSSPLIERVAILDFDVHHGNGTESIFYERSDVLFSSIHQAPWYPGTGAVDDTGRGPGLGYTQNLPLAAGAGDEELLYAWRECIRPLWDTYQPQLIFLSAGFDGDRRDPLAHLNYTPSGYERLSAEILSWATEHGQRSIISVLEGGYHCEALAEDVALHLEALKP